MVSLPQKQHSSYYRNETTTSKRFQDTVIDILEATNEKIVYKVMSDGLTERTFDKHELPRDYLNCELAYKVMNKRQWK